MILHSLNSAARYRPEIQACGAAVRGQPPAIFFKELFVDFSVMIHHAHSTLNGKVSETQYVRALHMVC